MEAFLDMQVAESIRQCSYITPVIVDEDHVIIAGHTRYKALKAIGESQAECLICDGLTEKQKKKYRFLDNKTGEKATWDLMKMEVELEGLDLEGFDFFCMAEDLPVDGEGVSSDKELNITKEIDALHTQPNRKLFDVMTKGSGDARMQPLYFLITTAGTDKKHLL